MTLYLLDTNILSNLAKPRPVQSIVDWCNRLAPRDWCIAQSTVVEIVRGIKLLQAKNEMLRSTAYREWFEVFLAMKPSIIVPDAKFIEIYTDLSVIPHLQDLFAPNPGRYPAKVGRDLEIAATAIAMRAVVVTLNTKDFLRINNYSRLPGLYNPETGEWFVRPRRRGIAVSNEISGHWDQHRRLGTKLLRVGHSDADTLR